MTKQTIDKETAKNEFMEMIEKSWTWARLTSAEKLRFCQVMDGAKISGSFDQRWRQLQSIYDAFLIALDYNPIGWREPTTNKQ